MIDEKRKRTAEVHLRGSQKNMIIGGFISAQRYK